MTTVAGAKQVMYDTFKTDWGTTSVYALDGEDFDPATDAKGVPNVLAFIRHTGSVQTSLGGAGNRKFERSGFFGMQIYARPLDNGSLVADNLAVVARDIFEGKKLTSGSNEVFFNDVVIREIGPTPDGYRVAVEAFFLYHETK